MPFKLIEEAAPVKSSFRLLDEAPTGSQPVVANGSTVADRFAAQSTVLEATAPLTAQAVSDAQLLKDTESFGFDDLAPGELTPGEKEAALYTGKQSAKVLSNAVRYVPPVVAGIATLNPGVAALTAGASEAAAQKLEQATSNRDKMSIPEIAGSTLGAGVGAALPVKAATSIGSFLGSRLAHGAATGGAYGVGEEIPGYVTGDKQFDWENLTKSALNVGEKAGMGAGLELGLGGVLHGTGALVRTARSGVGPRDAITRLGAEVLAPFEQQKQINLARTMTDFSDTTSARDFVNSFAGNLAQATRQNPADVARVLKTALADSASETGKPFVDSLVSKVEGQLGKLDDNARREIGDFAGDYMAASSASASTVGQSVKTAGQAEVDKFKADFKNRYDEVRNDPLFTQPRERTEVIESSTKGDQPATVLVHKDPSINDLIDQRTAAMKQIQWDKPVQSASYDKFEKLEAIQDKIDGALDSLPDTAMADKYRQINADYKSQIARFKGGYANQILKDIGQDGGVEGGIVGRLSGVSGADNLAALKGVLGTSFDKVKPEIGQVIYNDLALDGPEKFVQRLEDAFNGKSKGMQPEVVREFFPGLTANKLKAAKAEVEKANTTFATDFRKAITEGHELNNADPDTLVDFLNKGAGSYRSEKVRDFLASTAPGTLQDAQTALLSRVIGRAQSGGKLTSEALRKAAEGEYSNAFSGLFGGKSPKLDGIISALETAEKDATKTSTLSKLLTAGATAGGAMAAGRYSQNPLVIGSAAATAGYMAQRAQDRMRARVIAWALDNPQVRASLSKPYSELTNAETEMLKRALPAAISQSVAPTLNSFH